MKKKLFELLTMVIVLGMLVIGCDLSEDNGTEDNNNPNITNSKLTVNNLPSGEWGVYVFSNGTDVSSYQKIVDAWTNSDWQAVGAITSQTGGGNIFTLFEWNGATQTNEWKGNGNLPVVLIKMDGANFSGSFFDSTNPVYRQTNVNFSNGNGSIHFNNFFAIVMESLTITELSDGNYLLFVYPSSKELSYNDISNAIITADYIAIGAIMTALGGKYNEFALFNWNGTSQLGAFSANGTHKVLLIDMTDPFNIMYMTTSVYFNKGISTVSFGNFQISSPLSNWTVVNDVPFNSNSIGNIVYCNNAFIAVGSNSISIARSIDNGISWSKLDFSLSETFASGFTGIAYGNDTLVLVGQGYSGQGGKIAFSNDYGFSWLAVNEKIFEDRVTSIAYGNNCFIAIGYDSYGDGYGAGWKVARSIDNGETWSVVSDSPFGDSWINDISYGNGIFFILSIDGRIARSINNGETWTIVSDSKFNNGGSISGIAYGNNTLVAVGSMTNNYYDGGKIAISTDNGITWSITTEGNSTFPLEGIAYGGNAFVIFSGNGRRYYSFDNTVTLISVSDNIIGGIKSIAYGNDTFVATGLSTDRYSSLTLYSKVK